MAALLNSATRLAPVPVRTQIISRTKPAQASLEEAAANQQSIVAIVALGSAHLAPGEFERWADIPSVHPLLERADRRDWRRAFVQLTRPDKIAFYRGLVLADRRMGWRGGSGEPINKVLHQWLKRRVTGIEFRELVDWSIQNRGNDYIPFGRFSKARSLTEFETLREMRRLRAEANKERALEAQQTRARRLEAKRSNAPIRKAKYEERRRMHRRTMQWLTQLAPIERFRWLSVQNRWPLPALAPALFVPHDMVIAELTPTQRARLANVTAPYQWSRRHWSKVHRALAVVPAESRPSKI